ncbi:MAG: peptide chain release factor N(5)-glutamine methyltransferase [Candidatus Omnitrophica bacterium]|nr:peptide chain release factor N(5)-glutamine methyltransferase [Candidatus Omnitrophota bacterium]
MNENEQILTSILNCRRIDLYSDTLRLTPEQQQQFNQILMRRREGEPLQYLLGFSDFMGIKLRVDQRVLIPRPETEIMVDKAVYTIQTSFHPKKIKRVLDLGTGSGNIAIALAKFLHTVFVTSVDISLGAIETATINAQMNQVDNHIYFSHDDMTTFMSKCLLWHSRYDMIISNPPYIKSGDLSTLPVDVRHEPELALNGGEDGLKFYYLIALFAHQLLKDDGYLFLEVGDQQRPSLEKIFSRYQKYYELEFIQDYTGTDRVLKAKRISRKLFSRRQPKSKDQ